MITYTSAIPLAMELKTFSGVRKLENVSIGSRTESASAVMEAVFLRRSGTWLVPERPLCAFSRLFVTSFGSVGLAWMTA